MTESQTSSNVCAGAACRHFIDKARTIITNPKSCWPALRAESGGLKELYVPYVLIGAAITPLAAFIGIQIFGFPGGLITVRPSFVGHFVGTIVTYIAALLHIPIMAAILKTLAPKFDGNSDFISAARLAAYGATPAWVSGILLLFPLLSPIAGILSLYSLYLLYQGITPMLDVKEDKRAIFTVVTIVTAIVVMILVGLVSRLLAPMPY